MSRHIIDHSHARRTALRAIRFAQSEHRKLPHPATHALSSAPRGAGPGRIRAFTRIERQAKT